MQQQERRAWPRIKRNIRALIHDPEDALEQPYVGWILDESHGGLCLAYKRIGWKTGDVFSVQPAVPEDGKQPWFTVMVKNGRWRNNRLELGCAFVDGHACAG